jgi:hypothetical protein
MEAIRAASADRGIVHVMSRTPGSSRAPRTGGALSAEEIAPCERVAARLHADLGSLVTQLPEPSRGGSAMSRELGVVRNTCQRVAHALSDDTPSLDTLVKLPGVKGLDQLLDSMRARGFDARSVDMARAAVRQFEEIIQSFGGSHSKLCDRIKRTTTPEGEFSLGSLDARRALFESAVGVTGRSAQTTISLYAFKGEPGDPGLLQRAVATGLIQTTVVPGGMPVVLSNGDTLDWIDERSDHLRNLDDSEARGSTPEALLREFTSEPLPVVTSRGRPEALIRVVDPSGLEGAKTFDVVTAARSNHPFTDHNGDLVLDEVWSLANCPAVRLIFDVYLHETLERYFRPALDVQQWYPNLSAPGGDRWVLRYPSVPKLELLGRGTERAGSAGYARQRELTSALFERVGWDEREFYGLRCEVEYPIWRAGYCMTFRPAGGAS